MAFAWVTLALSDLPAAWILTRKTGTASKSGGSLPRLTYFCISMYCFVFPLGHILNNWGKLHLYFTTLSNNWSHVIDCKIQHANHSFRWRTKPPNIQSGFSLQDKTLKPIFKRLILDKAATLLINYHFLSAYFVPAAVLSIWFMVISFNS